MLNLHDQYSDGNLVPVVLDLVPKPNFSSKFSTSNSLLPELVPRKKSSAKFSTWKKNKITKNHG